MSKYLCKITASYFSSFFISNSPWTHVKFSKTFCLGYDNFCSFWENKQTNILFAYSTDSLRFFNLKGSLGAKCFDMFKSFLFQKRTFMHTSVSFHQMHLNISFNVRINPEIYLVMCCGHLGYQVSQFKQCIA